MVASSFTDGPTTFTAGEALTKYRLVSINPSNTAQVVYCDAGMDPIGYIRETVASGDPVAVYQLSGEKTIQLEAAAAIVAGSIVYPADNGEVDDVNSGGRPIGRFLDRGRGNAADGDHIEVVLINTGGQTYASVAESSDVTNTTTATPFDVNYTIQANTLQAGDTFHITGVVKTDATVSTDTFLYSVDLDGTAAATSNAVDVANNDVGVFDLYLTFRTVGATGTAVLWGQISDVDAEQDAGQPAFQAFYEDASIDTTADIVIDVTGTWSAAAAGNQASLKAFVVTKLT